MKTKTEISVVEAAIDPDELNELGVGEVLEEAEIISPEEWLEADDANLTDFITITVGGQPRKLKIAALTEGEQDGLLRSSRKPGKPGQAPKQDLEAFKLQSIAYSINKANGKVGQGGTLLPGAIPFPALKAKLGGQLTEIYKAISRLSGFDTGQDEVESAKALFD